MRTECRRCLPILAGSRHLKRKLVALCSAIAVAGLAIAGVLSWNAGAESNMLPAFPGAEGFGAGARGGRGGVVMRVTSLEDGGPGSLRVAVESSGPRIVVFDVSGTITLRSKLKIANPYITVAGQSAPGGGIGIRTDASYDGPAISIDTNDVVLRHLRIRPGPSRQRSVDVDALVIAGGYNIIVDHCSLSWGTDEVLSTFGNPRDITVQWSILSEGLHDSTHEEGPHSRGVLLGGTASNISFHHNLIAHHLRRMPRVSEIQLADVVNNVLYNWGDEALLTQGVERRTTINIVGNYAVAGSNTFPNRLWMVKHGYGNASIFLSGNIGPTRPSDALPEAEALHPDDHRFRTFFRHPAPLIATTTSAGEALKRVIAFSGATLPVRDSVDQRVTNDVTNLTGGIINSPEDVGGWPELEISQRPWEFDTDGDGMPDEWERAYGFNPEEPEDGPMDADRNGYTNVEEYLNQLAQLPPKVDAGADQTVELPSPAFLDGAAFDDGIPSPPGEIAYSWSVASGAGLAHFADPHAATTTVTFSSSGRYTLRLKASDGNASSSDEITVTVTGCCSGLVPTRGRIRIR